jgi:hypothetical protein
MTATVESFSLTKSPGGHWYLNESAPTRIDETSPEWQEFAAKQIDRNNRFDATRPPCPAWCIGECQADGHFGDAVMHTSDIVNVPATSSLAQPGEPRAWIEIHRHDSLDHPTELLVEVNLADAEGAYEECADFTPAQARRFAAELLRHADMAEPEFDLPAEDVRVGDLFPVGDDWLYVYCVLVDEPAKNVQINTTVEPGEWPELDGDEDPHMFAIGDTVRIRRGGAR